MTSDSGNSIRILLADDHPIMVAGVRGLINDAPDMTVVGEAASGVQALRMIADVRPDVAVIDVAMPNTHGVAVMKQLVADASRTRVVFLSGHEDRTYVREALSAGARSYVLKRSAGQHLLQAIRAVHDGGLYLDPAIADRFVLAGDFIVPRTHGRPAAGNSKLTDRERDVIRLIALGFTNKEIAGKLGVTSKSIETYRMRAGDKLEIRTRAKIVQYAMFQGWFENPAL